MDSGLRLLPVLVWGPCELHFYLGRSGGFHTSIARSSRSPFDVPKNTRPSWTKAVRPAGHSSPSSAQVSQPELQSKLGSGADPFFVLLCCGWGCPHECRHGQEQRLGSSIVPQFGGTGLGQFLSGCALWLTMHFSIVRHLILPTVAEGK